MTRAASVRARARKKTMDDDGHEEQLLVAALSRVQRAIFKYPMATQAIFSALVAEGRRFAKTPEGAEWRERLRRAEQSDRARMLWEVLSLSAYTEQADGALPSLLLENLARAIKTRHLEGLLSKVFEKRF